MKYKVKLSKKAREDMKNICVSATQEEIDELLATFEMLAENPCVGVPISEEEFNRVCGYKSKKKN